MNRIARALVLAAVVAVVPLTGATAALASESVPASTQSTAAEKRWWICGWIAKWECELQRGDFRKRGYKVGDIEVSPDIGLQFQFWKD